MFALLPLTISDLINDSVTCLIVEGVMSRDFGPWKKGEQKCLTFNFEEGIVREYCNDGVVVAWCKIMLEAVP